MAPNRFVVTINTGRDVIVSKANTRLRYVLSLLVLTASCILVAHAGIRGPGKYCGVVVFDRWDTCFLLSGPYVTYISKSVKNGLRPYAGRAMQIDASKVFQPWNPGDALIEEYTIIGPAPDTNRWAILKGLELLATSDFGARGTPAFLIEIRNTGITSIEINSREVGPVLLGTASSGLSTASDGDSTAVITRGDLVNASSWGSTTDGVTRSWSYTIFPETQPSERLQLSPGQSMRARIVFDVPPGEYQFMFGYGGGVHEEMSLASNAISFDLTAERVAKLAK